MPTAETSAWKLRSAIWRLSLRQEISASRPSHGRRCNPGGNIEVMRCHGALRISTAGGNINLGEMDGEVRAESGGGAIRIGVARGDVHVATMMGDMELWKLSQGAVARTGAGRITAEFIGDRRSMHDSELATTIGDIITYFAEVTPATLHVVSAVGPAKRIITEFPDVRIIGFVPEYGPNSIAAAGAVHGGGPVIEMRTMAGHIELHTIK